MCDDLETPCVRFPEFGEVLGMLEIGSGVGIELKPTSQKVSWKFASSENLSGL